MSASLNANEVFITHLVNGQSITVTTGADSEARIERSLREKEVHHQRIGAASSSTIGNNLPDMDVTIRCVRGTATVSDPVAASAGGGDITAAGDNTFTGTNIFAGPFHVGPDESTLPEWMQGYVGAPNLIVGDADGYGIGVEVHNSDHATPAYFLGSGKRPFGMLAEAYIETPESGGMARSVSATVGTVGASSADYLHSFDSYIYIPGDATGTILDAAHYYASASDIGPSATVTNLYGLLIHDQTGATNNYAIKTGAGKNYLGDSLTWRPPASIAPAANGDLTVEATSNTTLTFKLKGSDGVVRTGTLTLS